MFLCRSSESLHFTSFRYIGRSRGDAAHRLPRTIDPYGPFRQSSPPMSFVGEADPGLPQKTTTHRSSVPLSRVQACDKSAGRRGRRPLQGKTVGKGITFPFRCHRGASGSTPPTGRLRSACPTCVREGGCRRQTGGLLLPFRCHRGADALIRIMDCRKTYKLVILRSAERRRICKIHRLCLRKTYE